MRNDHGMRRNEKEIKDPAELKRVLAGTQYITIAMCRTDQPYLATLSHGYDRKRHAIYFHCAREGRKIDFLKANNRVWGQAIEDHGYMPGKCDHLFVSVQFGGRVTFIEEAEEKRHALEVMIRQLEQAPEMVMAAQVNDASVAKVCIGRIDIESLSGKKSLQAFEST